MTEDESMTADVFCRKFVEPMGEESEHIHAQVLTDAFQVAVRVMYLDSRDHGTDNSVSKVDFIPEGCTGADAVPHVHVLYRPGHYDILYPL